MEDCYASSCFCLFPALIVVAHTSLVHAGGFVHLRNGQFLLQRTFNWLPLPCILLYCPVRCAATSLQLGRRMGVNGHKITLDFLWILNTTQVLLLPCSTVTGCRKKWACGATFIVQETLRCTQECFMTGSAYWASKAGAKTRFVRWMKAQHFHLQNELCNLSVLPLAYFPAPLGCLISPLRTRGQRCLVGLWKCSCRQAGVGIRQLICNSLMGRVWRSEKTCRSTACLSIVILLSLHIGPRPAHHEVTAGRVLLLATVHARGLEDAWS